MSVICIIMDCDAEGLYEIYNPTSGQYAWICEGCSEYVPQINGHNSALDLDLTDEEVAWVMQIYNPHIHSEGITDEVKEGLTERQIQILEAYHEFTNWTPYEEE